MYTYTYMCVRVCVCARARVCASGWVSVCPTFQVRLERRNCNYIRGNLLVSFPVYSLATHACYFFEAASLLLPYSKGSKPKQGFPMSL